MHSHGRGTGEQASLPFASRRRPHTSSPSPARAKCCHMAKSHIRCRHRRHPIIDCFLAIPAYIRPYYVVAHSSISTAHSQVLIYLCVAPLCSATARKLVRIEAPLLMNITLRQGQYPTLTTVRCVATVVLLSEGLCPI